MRPAPRHVHFSPLSAVRRCASIADEIVCAHRAAEIGPAARAPVIDEPGFANVGLETLRLAQRRVLEEATGVKTPMRLVADFNADARGLSKTRTGAPT